MWVFGRVNELNPCNRTSVSSMLPVLRQYISIFTEGEWLLLFPMKLNRVYASQWTLGNTKLWTRTNDDWQNFRGIICKKH